MADWVNGGFGLFRAKIAIFCWTSENFEKKILKIAKKHQKTSKIVRHLAHHDCTRIFSESSKPAWNGKGG